MKIFEISISRSRYTNAEQHVNLLMHHLRYVNSLLLHRAKREHVLKYQEAKQMSTAHCIKKNKRREQKSKINRENGISENEIKR